MGRAGLVADLGAQPHKEPAHLRRVGVARGVRQAHVVSPGASALHGQADHLVLGHRALQGATEGGGNGRLQADLRRHAAAQRIDQPHFLDHRLRAFAHIGHGMRGAG